MVLTKEQIDLLFAFTQKKLVHYYDVQIELVDHLAAAIEAEMEKDKGLSFDDALSKIYRAFGIFGFSKIVSAKTSSLEKQHSKLWRTAVKELFYWPNIILSATILLGLYTALQLLNVWVFKGILVVGYLIASVCLIKKLRKKHSASKKLLILEVYRPDIGLFPAIFLQLFFLEKINFYPSLLLGLSFFIIIFTMASFQVNKKILNQCRLLYPTLFSVR